MKESIGNTMIFNLILIFTGIIIAILVSSIGYSKAFKVKNRILNIVEKYAEYKQLNTSDWNDTNSEIVNEINSSLRSIGYKMSSGSSSCPNGDGELLTTTTDYEYCVYKYTTNSGPYYEVVSYMYFDFPIINDFLKFPVKGQTKVIYELKDIE